MPAGSRCFEFQLGLARCVTHLRRASLPRARKRRVGDEAYAVEELNAEMSAAFLCAQLGITPETRADHASYLDHWLKVLKADKKAIFTAAGHAQRACDYLFSLQAETPSEVAA